MSHWKDMRESAPHGLLPEPPLQLHSANAGLTPAITCQCMIDQNVNRCLCPKEGGIKNDEGKPPMSLVSQELMVGLAKVRQFGAMKYEVHNWRKGFKFSRSIDAALRHIHAFNAGEDYDQESKLTHIVHAIASLEHLLNDFCYHSENDDRWKKDE